MTSYKTPAAQTFTDALGKYLGGSEWQENVMIFVKSNCDKFYEVEDYDHEHHALWKTYQDICESILGMALESAGGSIESLEKALDEVASIPSKGPKEEVVKDILDRLMAFEDFESFSKMMEQAASEEDFSNNEHDVPTYAGTAQLASPGGSPSGGGNTDRGMGAGVSEDTLNQLLAFGFEQDLIDLVVAGSPTDTSLEQLVMTLSGMQAGGDSSPGYKSQKKGDKQPSAAAPSSPTHTRSEDKESAPTADNMSSPPADRGGGRRRWPSHLEQFAKEGELGDVSELHAKFVMARSLLDTFIDGDVSPGVVLLVQWASDMVELHAEVEMAHARKQSMTEPCDKRPDADSGGLVGWYNELEETRRVADESQVAGNMLSDTEVARMAELDRIAGTGTEDEQLLHAMISRHDEVQKTINNLHQRCGAMCGPGTGMSRQTLEELYLFLKEKVNEAPGGGGGADGEEVDLSQVADELHEHVYSKVDSAHGRDVINILLEMHVMEDEQALLRQKIDSILGSPSRGADAKEGRSSPHFFAEGEGKDGDGDSKAAEAKESKEEADAEAAAQRVSALKNKHKDSLRTLKDSLDAEKDKKLSALESRLMRRRRAKEKELAALKKEGGSAEDEKSLRETMEAAEAEIQKEIDDNTASFDKLKESIMGGFKKACIYEINATKAKGAALSKEEEEEAHKEAAEALKKRYLRDRKALSESLEADRLRRRKMMMVQLMKKKKALGGDSQAITQAEAEAAEAIAEMELDFDKQQRISLAEPEEHVLLGLAGIFSDVASLKKKKNTDDDDDDFFDEDEEGGDNTNKKWLENVLRSRDAFMLAGQSLQDKLHSAGLTPEEIEKILRQMEESPDGELTSEWLQTQGIEAEGVDPVGEHMLKVLTDAFTKQIGGASSSSAKAGLFDAEKARAGIIDEFKRSKGAYDEALAHAQQQSKDAIARRRAKKRGGVGDGMGADAKNAGDDMDGELRFTRSTNDYENAVDAFLEDGLMFGGNAGASRVQNPSFASMVKDFDGYKHRGPKPTRVTKAARGAEEKGESPSDSIAQSAKKDKQAREAKEEAENREELSSIRTKAADKESDLIAALELEMQRKKAALKLRISKRKAKNEDDAFGAEAEDDGAADEAEQLKDIEAAFDKAVGLLKKTEESRLNGVNVGQLIDVMNRFANKAESKRDALKRAHSGGTSSSSPLPPINARSEAKGSSSFEEVEDFMSELGLNAPEPMALTHVERQVEQRRNMAVKAEKIADTFNEENQKLDLMMRIQQARQKQSLQRKLLARKSGLDISSSGGGNIRGGAGFSSSGSNQLPARGLDNSVTREEAMRSPTGPNENRQHAMNASSRGMDMTRLLRK
jgi:hypothetical protein